MAGYDARFLDGRQHSCEPQACTDGTLYCYTGTVCGPLGYVVSDMDDTVFKCLVPPCISDGAGCWLVLVRNSTAWRIWRVLATVFVLVIIAEQKAPMAWLELTRVCGTTAPPTKWTIIPLCAC